MKNNLYKQFCQAINPAQRVSPSQKFKNYRYQIVTLNCLCKEDYCKAYFETNKKDLKKSGLVLKLSSVLRNLKMYLKHLL